jgi:sugar/nucleoside kinase (ribokinase family)
MLFAAMKARGLTTSLDTNDDPADQWGEVLARVFASVDILFCNLRGLAKITGLPQVEEAGPKLAEQVPNVVVKRGPAGASLYTRNGPLAAPGVPTAVVDTVGSGDSFAAGFLTQWLRGAPLAQCLAYANLTGALSTTRPGGTEAFRDVEHREAFLTDRMSR